MTSYRWEKFGIMKKGKRRNTDPHIKGKHMFVPGAWDGTYGGKHIVIGVFE